jgi:hypothetical protein
MAAGSGMSQLPGWSPFRRAEAAPLPSDEEIARSARRNNVTFQTMKALLEDIQHDLVMVNSRYQVNIRKQEQDNFPAVISLSIKRRDKQRVGPERYRDFLRIKNELVGPQHEAFELYPAMDRNVDTANQYYLWVLANPTLRFPVGFRDKSMSVPHPEENSINAPFDEGDLPGGKP